MSTDRPTATSRRGAWTGSISIRMLLVVAIMAIAGNASIPTARGQDPFDFGALPDAPGLPELPRNPAPEAGAIQDRDALPATPSLIDGRYQDHFESARPTWRREAQGPLGHIELLNHDRTAQAAFDGRFSERIEFVAHDVGGFYFSYRLPRVPLSEGFAASLAVRSNRIGAQLMARVVLPGHKDPETGQNYFVVTGGNAPESTYRLIDGWQTLFVRDVLEDVRAQVRIGQARLNRAIPLTGAYIDQLVINVQGALGPSEIYLDALSVSPVPEGAILPEAGAGPGMPGAIAGGRDVAEDPLVTGRLRLEGSQLELDGHPWLFRLADMPGVDPAEIYLSGFHGIVVDVDEDPGRIQQALDQRLVLMVRLRPDTPEGMLRQARAFPFAESVAFWSLGRDLGRAHDLEERGGDRERIRYSDRIFRNEPGRFRNGPAFSGLTTGEVAGEWSAYSQTPQNLSLLGVNADGWAAMQDPWDARRFLNQRRLDTALANQRGLFWTTVEASTPNEVLRAIWGLDVPPAWGYPQVQPEQIRLGYYQAMAAGYRGLIVRGDPSLMQGDGLGRARLLELTLLNAEVQLLEPLLAHPKASDLRMLDVYEARPRPRPAGELIPFERAPQEVRAHPSIRALAVRSHDRRSQLLMITDFAPGAQWQPPQMAASAIKIRVPGTYRNALPYRITLGGLQPLDGKLVPGGLEVTVPDFGPTDLVLVTTDVPFEAKDRGRTFTQRLQDQILGVRARAVELALEQAQVQLDWFNETQGRLVTLRNRSVPQAEAIVQRAQETLAEARASYASQDYAEAWAAARRVARPLRLLMREHWEQALRTLTEATDASRRAQPDTERSATVRSLVAPIAAPPLCSFNTLPQLYYWASNVSSRFGPSLVPGGDFESAEVLSQAGWTQEGYDNPDFPSRMIIQDDQGADGGRVLRFSVGPETVEEIDRLSPYLVHPAAAVRTPELMVGPTGQPRDAEAPLRVGDLLRIRVKVRLPRPLPPGGGGLIVRDSIGGRRLQWRATDAIPEWSEVVLYRRVPDDRPVSVLIGLAGFGDAYFDDLRVEQLVLSDGPVADADEPPARVRVRVR